MKTREATVTGILRQGEHCYYKVKQIGGEHRYLAIPYIIDFVEVRGYYPPPVIVTFHGPYLEEEFCCEGGEEGEITLQYLSRENHTTYPKEFQVGNN